ncbi:MAG: inositol monophosphatase [Rhodospirillales bacterium]|nr:inositol monophosphatase [Rhodospirillales bacterium]
MAQRRSALINVMANAAIRAGRSLTRSFGDIEKLQVSMKGPADYVSEADHRSEKILFEDLQKARPHYGFLMEEAGVVEGTDNSNTWIIDPLDGTMNFLHGIPHFSISIGLERDRDLFAGVVYEPITDQMFWAEQGKGAFLNERRLRVSTRRDVKECLFSTGIPFAGREGHKSYLAQLENVMAGAAGVRRTGSAALDLAYVAAGRYDGWWEKGIKPWDIAAGIVLVREAGGVISDYSGKKEMMKKGEVIAANVDVHKPLKRFLDDAA